VPFGRHFRLKIRSATGYHTAPEICSKQKHSPADRLELKANFYNLNHRAINLSKPIDSRILPRSQSWILGLLPHSTATRGSEARGQSTSSKISRLDRIGCNFPQLVYNLPSVLEIFKHHELPTRLWTSVTAIQHQLHLY
jgi:hypothetical protein